MSKQTTFEYEADHAIPPGETLRETIEVLDLSQVEVARRTGISLKHLNQIVQGYAPISHETALALERVTGVPAHFWDSLEANYRRRVLRAAETKVLTGPAAKDWIRAVPTRELVRRGLIEDSSATPVLVQQLLTFFGVASIDAWHQVWGSRKRAFFRLPSGSEPEPGPLAAWLREGELKARIVDVGVTYDEEGFEAAFESIRNATRNPRTAIDEVQRICRTVGVVFVVVPTYENAPISGAARWLTPTKPIIQLSLRYKRDDHFWFSFFHEVAHLMRHPKKPVYVDAVPDRVDSDADETEKEANEFAAGALIPSELDGRLNQVASISDAIDLAEEIGIAPGIVVGQLHYRGRPWNWGNNLRATVRLPRGSGSS